MRGPSRAPGGRRRAPRIAITVAILALAVLPEVTSFARGASCEQWERRRLDLDGARELARTQTAPPAEPADAGVARAAEEYIEEQRRTPLGRLAEVADWVKGRYAGCGAIDSAAATSTVLESRRYAILVVFGPRSSLRSAEGQGAAPRASDEGYPWRAP